MSKFGVKVLGQDQVSGVQWSILGSRLCRVQQRAKKSHQSRVFVCVSNNCTDVVDRLLIRIVYLQSKLWRGRGGRKFVGRVGNFFLYVLGTCTTETNWFNY